MARVTLQTIADAVGVSRMTVSNAFSQPDQLSEALRQRILAVADELGYAGPDPVGRALARGTTGTVGILLTDSLQEAFTDEVATTFLASIAGELERHGLALTLLTGTAGSPLAEQIAVDGALIYSCDMSSPAHAALARRRLPLVLVDQDAKRGVPSVNVADENGAYAAGRHIAELGHAHALLLTYAAPRHDPAAVDVEFGRAERDRLHGWQRGLAGVRTDVVAVRHDASDAEVRAAAAAALGAPDRPTAVLCFSDAMALNVLRVAAELGLSVPGDLSVVGFDDARSASVVTPSLTTVRQDVTAKGRVAAELLLQAISDRRAGRRRTATHVMLPTELVVRESTAAPRPNVPGHNT